VKLPLILSIARSNFRVPLTGFKNVGLNSSNGIITHTHASQVIEFNLPFPWVIYSLHFAHGNVSESTFTMNVFRF